jgi:hypothetical protein
MLQGAWLLLLPLLWAALLLAAPLCLLHLRPLQSSCLQAQMLQLLQFYGTLLPWAAAALSALARQQELQELQVLLSLPVALLPTRGCGVCCAS